jgi:hypothetical protein
MSHTESSRAKIREKVDLTKSDLPKVVDRMRARFTKPIEDKHYMKPTISSLAKRKNIIPER